MLALRSARHAHHQVDLAGREGREQLRHIGIGLRLDDDVRSDERPQIIAAQAGKAPIVDCFERRPSVCEHADDEPGGKRATRRRGSVRRQTGRKRERRDEEHDAHHSGLQQMPQ